MTQDQTGCVIDQVRGTMMQVGGGRKFYPLNPCAEEVDIKDIARSLSRIVRFGGHSDLAINVAHHSINCMLLAFELEPKDTVINMQRYMLLHDAAEAYVGDMIRPLKIMMLKYQKAESAVWNTIVEALNIAEVDMKRVRYYDNIACAWEKRDLFKSAGKWDGMPPIEHLNLETLVPWTSETSEDRFLLAYKVLS